MKRFSIIVPIYNARDFLYEVLRPLALLDDDWQVVLVDDGSSDGSAKVGRSLLPKATVVSLSGPNGPAFARNKGVEASSGEILVFLDSDVVCEPETLGALVASLLESQEIDAVFGAYDDEPRSQLPVSKFRNLLHHFVHAECEGRVDTFWSGFGAIRRSAFVEIKGFNHRRFASPSVEDIELGGRLFRAGYKAEVRPELRVKHLKEWTLRGFLSTDTFQRARPWTTLILERQVGAENLNLRSDFRKPVLLMFCWLFLLILSFWVEPARAALAVLTSLYALANLRLYKFFARHGLLLWAPILLALHHLCAIFGAGLAIVDWLRSGDSRLKESKE